LHPESFCSPGFFFSFHFPKLERHFETECPSSLFLRRRGPPMGYSFLGRGTLAMRADFVRVNSSTFFPLMVKLFRFSCLSPYALSFFPGGRSRFSIPAFFLGRYSPVFRCRPFSSGPTVIFGSIVRLVFCVSIDADQRSPPSFVMLMKLIRVSVLPLALPIEKPSFVFPRRDDVTFAFRGGKVLLIIH